MESRHKTTELLLTELEVKDRMIAEESKAKYEAWARIAELQEEIRKLKGESNDS